MSALHFCAWGSIDVESMERLQRRRYINEIRKDLEKHGMALHVGGHKLRPDYKIGHKIDGIIMSDRSLSRICRRVLDLVEARSIEAND